MTEVQTIITAAGDSRKLFLPAGFGSPKSLVNWDGRSVILRAIDSYVVDAQDGCVAVHRDEDQEWDVAAAIVQEYPQLRVIRVPPRAKGALASALLAMEGMDLERPLVVAAGDSAISGGIGTFIDSFISDESDTGTIAFESSNPRWSYLSIEDETRNIRQVAEKRVIGPYATTGVFYFRTAGLFLDAATWCLVNNAMANNMFYVSTTLNYIVSQGMRAQFVAIPRHEYRSWSLPVDFTSQSE